jgi:hypothetical protein
MAQQALESRIRERAHRLWEEEANRRGATGSIGRRPSGR